MSITLVSEQQYKQKKERLYLLREAAEQRVKGVIPEDKIGPIHYLKIGMYEGRAHRVMYKSDYFSERA